MTTEQYKIAAQERDDKAIKIYLEHGEAAYLEFMLINKITLPPQIPLETKETEKVKREPYPHWHKSEEQERVERYYRGEDALSFKSNF
jgi:hypothetical protein